ncbi:MAG TPA: phosphatidylglycerophosphatase A [Chitinispirillaceae bacterium]|nr:phosphatidylglycerophosphatase A [Chitinispirillaceae bacterium]
MENNEPSRSVLYWIRKAGASLMFLGYIPFAPGTVGSAVTAGAIWYANSRWSFFFTPDNLVYYYAGIFVLVAVSIFLSSESMETFGREDAPQIIIDEVAGQYITFLMIPLSIETIVAGFLIFRFYDIVKPFPIYGLQEAPEGTGVTMDDVAAGFMANITMLILLAAYNWIKSYL